MPDVGARLEKCGGLIAEKEVLIALIEPVDTVHTGQVQSGLTRSIEEQLG